MIEAGNGDFICVGSTQFNDGDITGLHLDGATANYDVWTMRISNTGTILWSKVYGGAQPDHGQVIRMGIDGGYLIGGHASSNDFVLPPSLYSTWKENNWYPNGYQVVHR